MKDNMKYVYIFIPQITSVILDTQSDNSKAGVKKMLILWFYCQVFHKNEELLRRTLFLLSVITNIYNVIENDKNFHSPWCFFLKVKSLPWFSRKKNILEQEDRDTE